MPSIAVRKRLLERLTIIPEIEEPEAYVEIVRELVNRQESFLYLLNIQFIFCHCFSNALGYIV